MERITIKDLTTRLNEWEPHTEIETAVETSGVVVLEDTIWGLENGIYRPFGELQLPMQYENIHPCDEHLVQYNLLSIFTHDFFDGSPEKYEDYCDRLLPLIVVNDQLRNNKGKFYVFNEGWSDGISAKKVVQGFLEKFFKQYQDLANVENDEARECLQRSFIRYRIV